MLTFPAERGVGGQTVDTINVQVGQFIYWRKAFRQVLAVEHVLDTDGVLPSVIFTLGGTRARYTSPVRWDGDSCAPLTSQEVATAAMVARAKAGLALASARVG